MIQKHIANSTQWAAYTRSFFPWLESKSLFGDLAQPGMPNYKSRKRIEEAYWELQRLDAVLRWSETHNKLDHTESIDCDKILADINGHVEEIFSLLTWLNLC